MLSIKSVSFFCFHFLCLQQFQLLRPSPHHSIAVPLKYSVVTSVKQKRSFDRCLPELAPALRAFCSSTKWTLLSGRAVLGVAAKAVAT
jgi:hypothetical protein